MNWDKMVTITVPTGLNGWVQQGAVSINGRPPIKFPVGVETQVPYPVAEYIEQLIEMEEADIPPMPESTCVDNVARKRITALTEEITKHCATVAEMLALDNLVAGQRVRTNGYYAEGDGGHGEYLIVSEATVNPYDTLKTANGKYAVLQHNGHVNAKQCGLKNESYGGDAWFAFYNGTALSMDINVTPLYISNTVQLNNKTEIFSSNQSILYYVGEYDAAVLSCFPGNGLTAEEWQSTRSPKLHSLTINARNAKVGVCLVNVANTNRTIYDLHVYKGYVGYLLGESWRNIFGKLNGAEQTYATFVQEQSNSGELGDFAAISDSNSINTCVFE